MLKIRIIPCLDVDAGRVVKGINFLSLRDAGDPVEQAKAYSDEGADEITFLDITATHQKRSPMIDVISKTAEKCFVPLTVGGGVKNILDIKKFLLAGADKVSSIIFTDIEKDGLMEGANFAQLKKLLSLTKLNIIASGGVADLKDLTKLKKIKNKNLIGVISGKAIYEKKFSVSEAIKILEA